MEPISSVQSVVLGVVQGLTEFLPVSSSGHLVIFQNILGLAESRLLFDVVVHVGTLLAVVIVYGKDLWNVVSSFFRALVDCARGKSLRQSWKDNAFFRLGIYLVVGTIPAAVAGLLLRDPLEVAFGSLTTASGMLLVTGTILFLTRYKGEGGKGLEELTLWQAVVVGLFQSLALCPGLSRSGMTIAGGLYIGLSRDLAARFSFLLMVPAVLGASILELTDALKGTPTEHTIPLLLGGAVALVTGYLALRFLIGVVHRGRLYRFAYYCWPVGLIFLLYSLLSG